MTMTAIHEALAHARIHLLQPINHLTDGLAADLDDRLPAREVLHQGRDVDRCQIASITADGFIGRLFKRTPVAL